MEDEDAEQHEERVGNPEEEIKEEEEEALQELVDETPQGGKLEEGRGGRSVAADNDEDEEML